MAEKQRTDEQIEENVRFYLNILKQCANAQFDHFRRSHAQRLKDAAMKEIEAAVMRECECIIHGIMAGFLTNACIRLGMDMDKAIALGREEMERNVTDANGKFTMRLKRRKRP